MKKISLVLIILGLLLIVSPFARPLLAQTAVHWTYEGAEGPAHWGDLSPDYALCSTGTQQSPVDIPAAALLNPADITFNYHSAPLNILNNGHTIQVNYAPGSTATIGGKTYELKQFHFHIPSEHELGSAHKAMELHLVHQAADGELAVVGILLVPGAENAALAPIFSHLPTAVQPATPVDGVNVDAASFLPATQTYYHYDGSLTTPPCSQGVKWQVMSTPVELSQAQIDAFKAIFPENARPVQSLGDRTFSFISTLPQTGADIFAATWLLIGAGFVTLASGLGMLGLSRRRIRN